MHVRPNDVQNLLSILIHFLIFHVKYKIANLTLSFWKLIVSYLFLFSHHLQISRTPITQPPKGNGNFLIQSTENSFEDLWVLTSWPPNKFIKKKVMFIYIFVPVLYIHNATVGIKRKIQETKTLNFPPLSHDIGWLTRRMWVHKKFAITGISLHI